MLSRRRLALAIAAAGLLFVAGAAADPADNKFSASSSPSVVRPAPISAVYTVKLVNDPAPSADADRATIAPPAGFDVVGTPTPPTVSGCGDVQPWNIAELVDGTIAVSRTGSSANNLCPGGTLTVVFSATAAAAEGTYQWAVELRRGDVDPPFGLHNAQLSIRVDDTAPQTSISSGPASPTNQTSASFTFTSNEAGSSFECRRDGAAFAACTSPHTYQGLAAGAHTFEVRAIDPAGNVDGSPATHGWTIDLTPPTTTIASGPPATTNQTSASFTFTANQAGSSFQCRRDGAPFAACTSPQSYQGLAAGAHSFQVRAIDPAGNVDATPATHNWTIDLVGAATTILTAPPSATNSSSASFTLHGERGGDDVRLQPRRGPCSRPARHRRPTAASPTGRTRLPSARSMPATTRARRHRTPGRSIREPRGRRSDPVRRRSPTAGPRPWSSRPTSPRRSSAGWTPAA